MRYVALTRRRTSRVTLGHSATVELQALEAWVMEAREKMMDREDAMRRRQVITRTHEETLFYITFDTYLKLRLVTSFRGYLYMKAWLEF